MDGVYTDATWRDGDAGIAVVLIEYGYVSATHFDVIKISDSAAAEAAAVLWALALYPGLPIYCDCLSVAQRYGVNWVPRNKNQAAHRVSHRLPHSKSRRLRRFFPRVGAGVLPRAGL